jgi:uracil-DNA glycosylase
LKPPLTPALTDLLSYLGEIGYGDVYLRAAAASQQAAPAPHQAPELVAPAARPPLPSRAAVADSSAKTPDSAQRAAELAALAASAAVCTRCRLSEGRNRVVFASGNPDAGLMLIGEGPGAEEDRQGLPFVGPAGELLTRILQAMELSRDEVYIANVVKCRPPGNRDPQPDEVAACRAYLERQISLVQPRVIAILGKVAAQTLLGNQGSESSIGQMRGRWFQIQGVPAMVTYHPAALLRNTALKRPTWEDMQQVRDRLRTLSSAESSDRP